MISANLDDLTALVRYALETTRATTVCPFHDDVIIRVGDDAAESHAYERAKRILGSDGTAFDGNALKEEIGRQLAIAADGRCPKCDRTDPAR
ncbi:MULTISPECIES: hypothetical protein [unclassified Bradyrhizobium]|uniref:hypothetical protein n=1 Tax=unclassified Bradyrhizobium TaxID=2631580 RepID=UPI001FF0EE13|nr:MULTISPECIES: hypothetical protein [unclassified Bradyrhizobium]MCJ9705843.1 hypothetical protein [Bradyrhizobium sp. SHOUNA76]MCJ9735532.1 hypothetical protein [Bradyrhizobium sp. PRIMUS42]